METSPELAITELDVSQRIVKVLSGVGVRTVGDVLAKLEEGDMALTDLRGFGLKSLADLKKTLRARGFVLPGDEVPEETAEEEGAGSPEAAG